jgi:hypothetical protein
MNNIIMSAQPSLEDILTVRERFDQELILGQEMQLDKSGVLDVALKKVPAVPGAVHVNFFPHAGLFGMLLQRDTKMHVFDLFSNPNIAKLVVQRCQGQRQTIRRSIASSLAYPRPGMVQRNFSLQNPTLENADLTKLLPTYWLVLDHVRNADVLKKILGPRKVDSATILFPQSTMSVVAQFPFTCPLTHDSIDEEELRLRIDEAQSWLVSEAMMRATELVRGGGTLTYCNLVEKGSTPMGITPAVLEEFCADAWELSANIRGGIVQHAALGDLEANIITLKRKMTP